MKKEEVIEVMVALGFYLDYDQWDVAGKEWMRFEHEINKDDKEYRVIIFSNYTQTDILKIASKYLLKLGNYQKTKALKELLS